MVFYLLPVFTFLAEHLVSGHAVIGSVHEIPGLAEHAWPGHEGHNGSTVGTPDVDCAHCGVFGWNCFFVPVAVLDKLAYLHPGGIVPPEICCQFQL